MKENSLKFFSHIKFTKVVLLWLISIYFISFINIPSLPRNAQILESYTLTQRYTAVWVLASDASYYFDIARNWYSTTSVAFFPVWPVITKIFGATFISMEIIAIVFTLLFFILLSQMAKTLNFKEKNKEIVFLTILIFPASFVLATPLTEPLFLFLSVLTIFLVEKENYNKAAIIAALASATRPNGFLLGIYIFLRLLEDGFPKLKKYWYTIPVSASGIFFYFSYLHFAKNDFLLFFKEQQKWNASLSLNSVLGFFSFLFRFISRLFSSPKPEPLYWYHFFSFFFFIFLSFISYKKINKSLWVYSVVSVLLPVLSGSYSGLPRYLLAGFPLFIPFANTLAKNKLLFYLYLIVSVYFQTHILLRFLNFEAT